MSEADGFVSYVWSADENARPEPASRPYDFVRLVHSRPVLQPRFKSKNQNGYPGYSAPALQQGVKHYPTISFKDGDRRVGAVEFRPDKSNNRGILDAMGSASGVHSESDQEGIQDEKETWLQPGPRRNLIRRLRFCSSAAIGTARKSKPMVPLPGPLRELNR